jgi:pilus assembly protein CpaE
VRNVSGGHTAATVVVVGLSSDQMGLVRETLAAEAVLPNQSASYEEAGDAISRNRPDVVIVAYGADTQDAALELAQTAQHGNNKLTLVALAKKSDAQAILAAMRVGYKEFVVLPDDAERLRQVVRDAAFSTMDDEDKGMVIAFCGAKGGVGTTLIATNFAAELTGIHRVCLLDLDFGMGDAASALDLTPKDTIADLLPRADRLDERALVASMAVHRSRLHVMATPNDIDMIGEVTADAIFNVIHAAAKGYQFVIIDCGVYVDEAVGLAMNVADLVVLVTAPDVISVRGAFRRLSALDRLSVENSRIRLVVNRNDSNAYVSAEDMKENLGVSISAVIDEDARTVMQAVNQGKLIREINKNANVAHDIMGLVARLTEESDDDDDRVPASNAGGGFFSRLFGRG